MVTEFSVAKIDVGCGKKTKINHAAQKKSFSEECPKSILAGAKIRKKIR